VGIAEDITAYREILDRLRESEARYRALFETSSDGISIYSMPKTNDGQKFIDCNASYLGLAGRDKAELLNIADIKTLKKFLNKVTGDERRSPSLDLIDEDGRCSGLYSWVRPDGRKNFIECRGSRLILSGAAFMHCCKLARKIRKFCKYTQKNSFVDLHLIVRNQQLGFVLSSRFRHL
jgi:PAS domain-containing protein